MSSRAATLTAIFACLFFVAAGLLLYRYAGAQYDEVLFGGLIYPPVVPEFAFRQVPLMLMNYVGALKSWLYAAWLPIAGVSHLALRLPMLLAAALSIGIFFLVVRRLAGNWPAALAALLLASDTNYLVTSLYDWGPVAIQHLLFVITLYSVVRFNQQDNPRWLWLAGLATGLQLWDKAIHIWLLAGFGFALLVVFPREVYALAKKPRTWLPALVLFVVGASPLILYNLARQGNTFTAKAELTKSSYQVKIRLFDRCLAGNGLFGFITYSLPPKEPVALNPMEKASTWVDGLLRYPRYSLQHTLVLLTLLALPLFFFTPSGRLILWIVLGSLVTCMVMFSTYRAGGAIHHHILIWPMPQLLIALAAFEIHRRWRGRLPILLLSAAVITNLLVLNSFWSELARHGTTPQWTTALRGLIDVAGKRTNRRLAAAEWGILEQIRFFGQGRLGYFPGSDGWVAGLDQPEGQALVARALALPETIFILRPPMEGMEIVPGNTARLRKFAAERGYHETVLENVTDRHGHLAFQLVEYRKP